MMETCGATMLNDIRTGESSLTFEAEKLRYIRMEISALIQNPCDHIFPHPMYWLTRFFDQQPGYEEIRRGAEARI